MSAKEFFRGAGLWLSKALFVLLLVGFVAEIAASNLTSESFLKPIIGEMMLSQMTNMPVGDQYQGLLDMCEVQGTENISVPMETDFANLSLEVNCNDLRTNGEAEVTNIIKNQVTGALFSSFYNKKVCSGSSCIDMLKNLQNPLDLITADFNKFLKSSLWVLGTLAGLFGLFIILLAKGLPKKFLSLGGSLITAGLPYFMIKIIGKNIGSMIPSEAAMAVPFIVTLLDPVANIFLLILILGAVCCVVGWSIKIYRKYHEKKENRGKTGSKGKKK